MSQANAPTEGKTQTSDGATIAFRHWGSKDAAPRVVLIHSLALDGSMWEGVASILANEAQVVAIDCRGHGRSSRPPGPYTVERFADDVADVLDHLGWNRTFVAGCSMGGCVAQAFAARHARRVRALTLIDTTAWYGADAPSEWRKRGEKAKADGLASMAQFQATRWFGDRFRETQPERVNAAMSVFIANDLNCYAAACDMLGNTDLRPHLSGFDFPTSVIVGEEDYATPVQAARDLQESIPGASLTILPAARHLTPIECPVPIAAEISALIRHCVSSSES